MTKEQKSILISLFIGDGCLRRPNEGSVQAEIGHSIKQESYCLYKAKLLHSIIGGNMPNLKYRISSLNTETCRWVKTHRYFKTIRKWLYPNNKKTITRHLLDKLSPQGIAIWYMDDGWLAIRKNPSTGNPRSRHIGLGTYGFSYEEHLIMQKYFDEVWNIRFSIIKYKKQFKLVAGSIEGTKFINLVKSYILPEFKYKIDFKYSTRAQNSRDTDDIV